MEVSFTKKKAVIDMGERRHWFGTHPDLKGKEFVVTTGHSDKDGNWPVLFTGDDYEDLTNGFVAGGVWMVNEDGAGIMFSEDSDAARRLREE